LAVVRRPIRGRFRLFESIARLTLRAVYRTLRQQLE
jgi:hypothetical protein